MTAMQKQRVLVSVVGFSDVERHALNTVFRLSQSRDLSYAPYVPLTAPGVAAPLGVSEVALVDGECAEAVLSHAKELPTGQRLIWVGRDAPDHAWRVMDRPIDWAAVLHDLDAVYAAKQADSGLLDLDVTAPAPLDPAFGEDVIGVRRALVVGADEQERTYLRTRLALASVAQVDEVTNTEAAIAIIARNNYICGVFNLDDLQLDVWLLMRLFAEHNPKALTLATSELAGPLAGWWSRRRVRRNARRAGISALLARPIQPPEISVWLNLL